MTDRICDETDPRPQDSGPGNLIRHSEFRALWTAYAQSVLGDQLARVALALLVFDRTDSPAWTAATYALTTLPALLSGVLLSGLADRFPRRTVMISCDLIRALLVALMALRGTPLPLLAALLVLAQLAEAPFGAAQGALLPTVLGERMYERGQRVMLITHQAGQLVGFAGGGVLVALLGTHNSLAVDAVTFLLSAVLIRTGVRSRAIQGDGERTTRLGAQVGSAAALIWSDPRHEHVHGAHGAVVIVDPHIKRFDVFGIIRDDHRFLKNFFRKKAFVFGLQIMTPVNGKLPGPAGFF